MNADLALAQHVTDQLADWAPIRPRRMFGGVGLFREARMFALVFDETLYLKSSTATAPAFDAIGAPPFRYQRQGRVVALSYRRAPDEALDDVAMLTHWAERAWMAAVSE